MRIGWVERTMGREREGSRTTPRFLDRPPGQVAVLFAELGKAGEELSTPNKVLVGRDNLQFCC